MGDGGVPGVEDTAGLARWILGNGLPGGGQDLAVALIAGGRSNLTYRLDFRPTGKPAMQGDGEAGSAPAMRLVLRRRKRYLGTWARTSRPAAVK